MLLRAGLGIGLQEGDRVALFFVRPQLFELVKLDGLGGHTSGGDLEFERGRGLFDAVGELLPAVVLLLLAG